MYSLFIFDYIGLVFGKVLAEHDDDDPVELCSESDIEATRISICYSATLYDMKAEGQTSQVISNA